MDHNIWRLVARLVEKWIIFGLDSILWEIFYGAHVLFVWVVLTLAGDHNVAWREWRLCRIFVRLTVIWFWLPIIDTIEFN